jgi:uncharacterized membrane protein
MPDIASFHPQIVHFVVVGGLLGLPLYWLAFVPRLRALRLTGTILLIVATVATWAAVKSGSEAHELAERIPGVGAAVRRHEELGEDTRSIFTGILLLELVALGIAWKARAPGRSIMDVGVGESGARDPSVFRFVAVTLRVVVGITWAFGAIVLFEAAEHGGDIVYSYAGGVGMRTGNPDDVQRLLVAGLYDQSREDRKHGDHEGAARLVHEMLRLQPDSAEVRLLWVESLLEDQKDGRAALAALDSIHAQDPRTRLRVALSAASAYQMVGEPDSARAALRSLPERLRQSRMVQERLKELGGSGS